ncbi:hypothetical protein [Actinoallomurus iriomotensis]|uniref:Uncharacterized protein n=1 Tax=Actinoallomurus iriomotensis TaxID=478107 RepID=A0A9W6RHZ5_9ACTN|nr:hypothetical protein [Actinoallomurus iriomotensis]GLY74387.1 hypothetical protein Airi01_026540 [Actinoallomurus iriomotensis]
MTNVIPLHRPAAVSSPRPRPRDGRPSSSRRSVLDPVRLTFDPTRSVHAAVCAQCAETESAYPDALGWLLGWAEAHRCDPELAALLASCDRGAA